MNPFSLSAFAGPSRPAPDPLAGSLHDHVRGDGPDLAAKAAPFCAWLDRRVAYGGFPFHKRLLSATGAETMVRLVDGATSSGLNFATHDYLNLTAHPDVRTAALEAVQRYGLNSGGAPILAGAAELADQLEAALASHLRTPHALLCPSGWAAGYGAVRALVREDDHVVLDQLAHNCLQEGATAATRNVHLFRHRDLAHARVKLAAIRARHPRSGLLVVTESLFSMDSDTPDLAALLDLCREYGALLLVDVAHDLGCMGPNGTGQLGLQGVLGQVDLVIGSLSKTFAANGGFIASARREVHEYLRYFVPSATFSSALAPFQTAAALAALRVVRSAEGEQRRRQLASAALALRTGLACRNHEAMGSASPIVPVFIGRDDVARCATRLLARSGVLVNLVEYPAVSRATARFRLQLSSAHDEASCALASMRIGAALEQARDACARRAAAA